jgi:hypothetical protein
MPCKHKFLADLSCTVSYKPDILIIGTFNPEWPVDNYASWFYGRTNNNYFWEILPRMFNDCSLRHSGPKRWKEFCSLKNIVITDLITSINDANEENPEHFEIISKFRDADFANYFKEIEMTNVLKIIEDNPTIKKVFFTRQDGVGMFDNQINIIDRHCKNKKIHFSRLLTPSANARFQMNGWHPQTPNLDRTLPNFIYESWLSKWD